MDSSKRYSTWVEVDLGAIQENIRYFLRRNDVQVMAIVKANAYGHGAVEVSKAALQAGASWLGVARVEEAMELRRAGISCPTLLLGFTPPSRMDEVIAEEVSMTLWNGDQVQAAGASARRVGKPARVHLKVDTGMSRLGAQPFEAYDLAGLIWDSPMVEFEGVFTHFARADEEDSGPTDIQDRTFIEVIKSLEASGRRPPLVHASNSAASLSRPGNIYNLLRPGIAIYGLHPSSQFHLPREFRPALTWKTALSQVKILPAGRGVSYGHIYNTLENERIGTLPVGYADGFRRSPGNLVLVGGCRVPVVGRVCMDQMMVKLSDAPGCSEGDESVLIGSQDNETISAEEVASRWGTINYEVVCGIAARVVRLYV